MPHYFFHVRDGTDYPDEDGTSLPDLQAARIHAVEIAGSLLADHPKKFWEGTDWHVEVTDADDVALFRLDFKATDLSPLKS